MDLSSKPLGMSLVLSIVFDFFSYGTLFSEIENCLEEVGSTSLSWAHMFFVSKMVRGSPDKVSFTLGKVGEGESLVAAQMV